MIQILSIDEDRFRKHLSLLHERVFQTATKWPHFNLLLEDLMRLTTELKPGASVVTLERALLYGGYSLVAPIFRGHRVTAVDCSPKTADERGAYNSDMIDDKRFVAVGIDRRVDIHDTGLPDESADLIVVPNLVHHVADQTALFKEMVRIVKPGGQAYVFEPLVRELHQIPDDFIRYTPYGLAETFRNVGLDPQEPRMAGGPFSVIAYCWAQALEYLPDDDREKMSKWFYGKEFKRLMKLDSQHPDNQVRDLTCFPMSFSLEGVKKRTI